jgi:hypothetical protein
MIVLEVSFFSLYLNCLISLEKVLMCAGKWLKILVPEYETPFWTNERFVAGKFKLCLQWVFRSWISKVDGKKSLYLTTNITNEKIYWVGSVKIWYWLNSCLQESRLNLLAIILIALFCILNILLLRLDEAQKMPYDMIEWK